MTRPQVFLLVLLFSCSRAVTQPKQAQPQVQPDAPYQRVITDRSATSARLATATLSEIPAVVDVVYRIRPDRRFVNAAADIVEITRGSKAGDVAIERADGAWDVRVAGEKAVSLPDLPAFHDGLDVLTRFASAQHMTAAASPSAAAFKSIDADIDRFYPRFLLSALRQLDHLPLDVAGPRAARAATLLAVQMYDVFEIGDPLRGRAIALLAIARSHDPVCCRETEALLAHVLGYESEAEKLAAGLPPGFARAKITGEDIKPDGTAAIGWLLLTRELHSKPIAAMAEGTAEFRGTIDTEAAPALLENRVFGETYPIGMIVQSLLARRPEPAFSFASDRSREELQNEPAAMLRQFESNLNRTAAAGATKLVDQRSVMSFREANWYAALQQEFAVYADFLGDVPGATKFAQSLQPQTATGRAVAAWMTQIIAAEYGRTERFDVRNAMTSVALLGGQMRYRLFDKIRGSVGGEEPRVRYAARDLFATLDSRPAETLVAAQLADYPAGVIPRRDLYFQSALERAPKQSEGWRATHLNQIGDRKALRSLVADRHAPTADRITALCAMTTWTDDDLHEAFENVFADQNHSLDYVHCYWDYLRNRKQPVLKERFARKLLEKRPELDAISKANVVAELGRGLEGQGRYADAWKAVEPHVGVYSAEILSSAVSILQRLGRNDDAIDLGRQMVQRYPDADTRGDFARVLWRMGRFAEAAELFNPAKHAYRIGLAQTTLPPKFMEAFSDANVAAGVAAFEALAHEQVPAQLLNYLPGAASVDKQWQLAVALTERFLKLPATGTDRGLQWKSLATGYGAVKEWKGADAALQWFLERAPAEAAVDVLIGLFTDRHDELLIRFAAARPPTTSQLDAAGTIAAALSVEHVPLADERWNVVRALIPRTVAANEQTEKLAIQHLLHEVDAQQVMASMGTAEDRSVGLYYIGLRHLVDGDYDRGLAELLVAGEGPRGYPPASWAITQLYMWRAKQRPWTAIAQERLL